MMSYEYAPGATYVMRHEPFDHQRKEWLLSRETPAKAIFWEQGTGKSKLTIDTACWLWHKGLIDGVLVVAPNGVHRNWVESELPEHLPNSLLKVTSCIHYQSTKSDTKWHKAAIQKLTNHTGFAWLTISYDAFMTAEGKKTLINFLDRRKVLYVLDESHNIKTPDIARTKSILKSAKYAPFRRLLTGTPIAQGPFDIYSQLQFLDSSFWANHGLGTFTEFKTHYGVFGKVWNPNIKKKFNPKTQRWERCDGADVPLLKSYRRLDELHDLLGPISSRVTKDDVLDIPPKLYSKRWFTMSPEQSKIYAQMKEEFIVWLTLGDKTPEPVIEAKPNGCCPSCLGAREINFEGFIYQCPDCADVETGQDGTHAVIASMAMTRLLRLQQIASGYLPTDDTDEPLYVVPGANRRLDALMDVIEDAAGKVIVWARFKLDIDLIMDALAQKGISAVRYDGQVNDDGRAESKARFQGERAIYENGQVVAREPIPVEEQARVFVGNPAVGATGLTLTAARTVVYYSNSFKLIDRLQSEDRAHRIGQLNKVYYVDLVAEGTVDEHIVKSLREKFNIASQITGDQLKEWL
jgi:SNF2 family DNA or RNA helicase